MMRETCYFASDYDEELRRLGTASDLAAATAIVQFPYTEAVSDSLSYRAWTLYADLTRQSWRNPKLSWLLPLRRGENKASGYRRCKPSSGPRRYVAMTLVQHDLELTVQLAVKIAELEEYKAVLSERTTAKRADFLASLVENTPFETEAELESWVKKTEGDIKRKQKKDTGDEEPEEDPVFPLVEIPDTELNEEEIKEKRKQRLMKAGWEARVKAREEKRKEKERQEEIRRREEEFRETDPTGWAAKLRAEQEVCTDKDALHWDSADETQSVIIRIEERKKKRAQLGNRKSAAAQSRMKTLANLAAEDNVSKKRKKGGDKDDGFGRDDSDWAVYREVVSCGPINPLLCL